MKNTLEKLHIFYILDIVIYVFVSSLLVSRVELEKVKSISKSLFFGEYGYFFCCHYKIDNIEYLYPGLLAILMGVVLIFSYKKELVHYKVLRQFQTALFSITSVLTSMLYLPFAFIVVDKLLSSSFSKREYFISFYMANYVLYVVFILVIIDLIRIIFRRT